MRSAATIERAISRMLRATLPARLLDEIGVDDAREWVSEHLECYREEHTRFPDQVLLPWSNMLSYDDDWNEAFFVILVLTEDAIELFCGTGPWLQVRKFGEGEAEDIPAGELHHEWATRFHVPKPPVRLSRREVRAWLGRDW